MIKYILKMSDDSVYLISEDTLKELTKITTERYPLLIKIEASLYGQDIEEFRDHMQFIFINPDFIISIHEFI